jgi:hypothetical protein
MEAGDLEMLRRLRWSESLRDEVEAILLAHLEHHLDKPIKSARILAEFRGVGAPNFESQFRSTVGDGRRVGGK